MKHLTERENVQLKSAYVRARFEAAYAALPPTSEFVAAALAGSAKRGWYANAQRAIESQYGADASRFAALLAALSPQVPLQVNVKNAKSVFDKWIASGRPLSKSAIIWYALRPAIDGELLGAWINNSVSALQSGGEHQMSGPKVDSFYRNLIGDMSAVTCDSWMAAFAGIEQKKLGGARTGRGPGKSAVYLALSARVRAAAKLLGWNPAEVQECIWAFTKTAYETASASGPSVTVASLVRAGTITDIIIGATPDIATLFAAESTGLGIAARAPSRAALFRIAERLDARLAAARGAGSEPNF